MKHPDEHWKLISEAMLSMDGLENSIDENFYEQDYSKTIIQDEILHIILTASAFTPPTTSDIEELVRIKLWLHPFSKSYIGTPYLPTHLQVRTVLQQTPGIVHYTKSTGVQTWSIY